MFSSEHSVIVSEFKGFFSSCPFCPFFNDEHPLDKTPPLHEHCRCYLNVAMAITAGTATIDGLYGADFYLKKYGKLPENYITSEEAKAMGWIKKKKNLHKVAPNNLLGGDIFNNDKGKLPQKSGRKWYEADMNYLGGKRNSHRLLYSNDGLLFVTYDHYETFYAIN